MGALAEFERNLIRERTNPGLKAAKARGRVGGRPKALSYTDLEAAKAMLASDAFGIADVARKLNVSASTMYKHFPGGKGGKIRA